jgi:hypothetical protein
MAQVKGGEVINLDGGLKYQGKLMNGLPQGHGFLTWPNGDTYDGYFKAGKRHGYGKRVNIDGSEYTGDYYEDKPHGRGKNGLFTLEMVVF